MLTSSNGRVLVWDAPTRVFHWLMVLSFACYQWWTAPGGNPAGVRTVSMSHTDPARRP
jgi:cytochrome b